MATPEHFLTLGQSARQTGIAKSTLSHDIKTGKLSVVEKTPSGFKIDPSELFRVYPPKPVHEQDDRTILNPVHEQAEQGFDPVLLHRSEAVIEQYEKRIADLTKALEREQANADFLKQQLERSTLLLEHQRPVPPAPVEQATPGKRGVFGLFRRRTP